MNKKITSLILGFNVLQIIIYLFGFCNKVAVQTSHEPMIDITMVWNNFWGIMFWSVLSMVSVIGFTLTLYLLVSKVYPSNQIVGLIISAVGFGSPLILGFFLIIPATLLILGTLFIKILILNPETTK